jgi:hypothetical protein
MRTDDAAEELRRFATERFGTGSDTSGLAVHRASVALDERQNGEPMTRITLLLDDPAGETWDLDQIRELRRELGRKATELDLPEVNVTLVPRSEAEYVDAFAE